MTDLEVARLREARLARLEVRAIHEEECGAASAVRTRQTEARAGGDAGSSACPRGLINEGRGMDADLIEGLVDAIQQERMAENIREYDRATVHAVLRALDAAGLQIVAATQE